MRAIQLGPFHTCHCNPRSCRVSHTDSPLELQVVVSPPVDISIGGTFSPTTATIITGPTEAVLVETLDGETIALDGHELRAIEIGQGDVAHSTVMHVPSIDAVIAGDLVYNGVHQMLGVSGPEDWPRWIDSVNKIAALNPKVVIAGHKADLPDDDVPAILDGTRN